MLRKIAFSILIFSWITALNSQIPVIFDTDFGGDADDLGALVMLHHLVDRGECELLGVMCWSTEIFAVPAIDAINRYYGHGDIPIGVRKEGSHRTDWNYSRPIAEKFSYELEQQDAEDCTTLYRRILSRAEDHSVVLVTVGPLKNIENLIRSAPDDLSPLNGKELIRSKVMEAVIMGGKFPEGENEWNFNGDMPGVTRFVLENLKVPVTFTGFEVGVRIKTGEVFNELPPEHPLHVGFMHFSAQSPWMKSNFKGRILDNSSYDQTAVLYAVRKGVGTYWRRITGGYCQADNHGGNRWVESGEPPYDHAYLQLIQEPEELAILIESIMLNRF